MVDRLRVPNEIAPLTWSNPDRLPYNTNDNTPPYIICILGLALVGNDAVKRANHCVSLTNQGTFLFIFLAVTMMVIELDHIVQGGES